ncbi:hypothetical protein KJ359_005361 [Pestalotiopsis sp. 9143b]|nr:hypothetical protein KJ359_005361 [Pestalotiopsis sp. 9143b]
MQLISLILGALALTDLSLASQHSYNVGSLASRANAMIGLRETAEGSEEKRSIWTSVILPKMVVKSDQAVEYAKRQLSIGNGGISIGGAGGLTLGGGGQRKGGQGAEGAQAGTNKTAEGIAALEGAKNNTGGGLTIGGLTLGGPGGGITSNNNQGQKEGQPAAAQPAESAAAAPAKGEATASAPAEGKAAPTGEAAAQNPAEVGAVRESEQFDGDLGITTDKNGNAVNLGGDLGITKGSDGSTSVGGEAGINIVGRAVGPAPASPKPLAAPALPSVPAAPAALAKPSLPARPGAAKEAPAPLAAVSVPAPPKALPSVAPAAVQAAPGRPSVLPASSPAKAEGPASPALAPAAPSGSAGAIPDFVPGTTPSAASA